MTDRASKLLLVVVAIGVWLNAVILALALLALTDASDALSFVEQWIISGAPVDPR